jgi:preprotein translocase subunit Sec63
MFYSTTEMASSSAFDPFEVLGVRPGATHKEIKAAYRERVARYHPDKHRGNPLEELAAAKLIEINRAYEILSDDRRRAEYTATGPGHGPMDSTTVQSMPAPLAKLVRSAGLLVGVVFFLRFGLGLARQVLLVVRGVILGVIGLARSSPILGIALLFAIVFALGYLLRSRKHRSS